MSSISTKVSRMFTVKFVRNKMLAIISSKSVPIENLFVLLSEKENMVAPFGRQATLTMIISYNDSDWTTGWNHLLKGATMFLTPSYEQEWDCVSY